MAAKSSQTEITRLSDARDKIRSTLVNWGKAEGTERLDALATTIENIKNNGSVSAQIKEGDTYTIPEGYHNGSGTVSGIAGGGEYNLQSKTVTPTKKQQNVTPDEGYYGLSDVTVAAIPANYQDVSATTATAPDVLANKVFTAKDGTTTTGEMPNNGAVSQKLTAEQPSYTVAKGYHDGLGTVSVDLETKSATPTKIQQTVSPTTGKLLSSVTVEAIPDEYITTDDATATAEHILNGDTAYVKGKKVTGTMPNNGAVSKTLDSATTNYAIPAGYHSGTGSVSIVTETKTLTPTKQQQVVPATSGKVISSVTVEAIPGNYIDTTDATAPAATILDGETAYVGGVKVEGSMPNNGAVEKTLTTTETSYTVPEGYHNGEGTDYWTDSDKQEITNEVLNNTAHKYVIQVIEANNWQDGSDDIYNYTFTNSSIPADCKLDIAFDTQDILQLISDGVSSIRADNDNGTVNVVCIGAKPTASITAQISFVKLVQA